MPQATAYLLLKHHRTLSGPKQEQRVNGRNIDTLVEQVDRTHHLQLARLQPTNNLFTDLMGIVGGHRHRCQSEFREYLRHEPGMIHAGAEGQSPHGGEIVHIPFDRLRHTSRADVAAGQYS